MLLTSAFTSFSTASVMENIGLSVTLPTAGTYMLNATLRTSISGNASSIGGLVWMYGQLYDTTNSAVVTNSLTMLTINALPVASTTIPFQSTLVIGPTLYTVQRNCNQCTGIMGSISGNWV